MTLTAKAPRGGLVEAVAGKSRTLILTNAEIERFEDAHRGIFEVWDGFMGRGKKPGLREVRDLVALGLVGGGLGDKVADRLMRDEGPDRAQDLYQIAQALVGIAFTPDLMMGDDEPRADGDQDEKKKTPAPPIGM